MYKGGGAAERAEVNIADQSEHLLKLWRQGVIENVYMSVEQDFENGGSFIHFISADNAAEASAILDEMSFVKNRVAEYQLRPVGKRWLGLYEVNN